MPPANRPASPAAKKRPRRYDSAKTRAAVLAQFRQVRDGVLALSPEALDGPTRLGAWTVRDLAAHLVWMMGSVPELLAAPAPPKSELALLDWPFRLAGAAERIDEWTRGMDAADLAGLFAETERAYEAALAGAPDERVLPVSLGAMTLGDFLVTRTVELVVHTDDLNAATGLAIPFDRQALAACTRLLADALAAKAPGGAVEVRIPPYAVVQCVEGPRHTRGTPPNVIETDPTTWLRLATGRAAWAAELDAARVSASGERADLTGLLPLLS
ncbi:sterol carrier family protein [Streptomyces sp. NPDC090025]|uniref:maleylpyruvate isomerase family mycothiol-dependent enzyme n=1 Tax=Streptomyces sp. NPDC090025 TaxID=3365922 RepID=UPI003832E72F